MKPVAFHSLARQEIDEAASFYEGKSPGLGVEFVAELERITDLMQKFPGIGTPYKDTPVRFSVLNRFPFVVYYEELETQLWVVAVAHGSRRQGYWNRRRPEKAGELENEP